MFDNESVTRAPSRPPQRRGMERRRAILDAAETLLGEQGYDAATLKAIGARAGIPITSVYHYFGDRHEVESELERRHLNEVNARVAAALDGTGPRTISDAVDAVIDPLLGYFRENPGFVQLWFGERRSTTLSKLAQDFDESQAEKLWRFLIERNLILADTPLLTLQLAFEAGNRLFDVAFRDSPTGDDTAIDEARRLVTAYLETYAPNHAARG